MNLFESQFTRRGPTVRSVAISRYINQYLQHVCPLYISLSRAKRLMPQRMRTGVSKPARTKRRTFLDAENM